MDKLSLRLRVFLLFSGFGVAGVAVVIFALWVGFARMEEAGATSALITAGLIAGFGLLGLTAGLWYLFDAFVARPVEHLTAALRSNAHAGVDMTVDEEQARHLGDLAPAVQAITGQLSQSTLEAAEAVAQETAHLAAEKEKLTALLTDIPMAMALISPSHQIVLYDGQAAAVLAQIHVPRLNASIFEYFDEEAVRAAHEEMLESGQEVAFPARGTAGRLTFDLRMKPLSHAPGYMLLIDETHALIAPDASRPLVYDFALSERETERDIAERPLRALDMAVFDTETTGLQPNRDEVVQLGAVRVVNAKIVPGEVIDELANPGRPIPPESTKVHKITDAMVADAASPQEVLSHFHRFAANAVIVAHNAPFDMAFLHRHGAREGLDWNHPVLDTVLLSAVVFGADAPHTLDALCDRLGIEIPPELRHTALGDAQATAEALCRLIPMLEARGLETFGQVIEQTRKHGRLLQDLN
ncbi:MAG: DNA polymerase III subunit epsilon [Rhodobacterales bacterium]|nr:MAG: DNA polymerase III subunit epsilon [Rhodobacterales bacterium]